MSVYLELAARCEAAMGGDRELDALIWAAVTEQQVVWTGADGHLLIIGDQAIGSIDPGKHARNFSCNRPTTGPGCIPAYTASLDAAMTLVPEGWGIGTDTYADHHKSRAQCVNDVARCVVNANTLALAVCAAALRARDTASTPEEL